MVNLYNSASMPAYRELVHPEPTGAVSLSILNPTFGP